MNHPHAPCDPQRIEGCLADALSDHERSSFEAHLENCPACREALERCAAPPADWREVREYLSSHETPRMVVDRSDVTAWHAASLPHSSSGAGGGECADDAGNLPESVDGVLNALAPTDDPHMLGRLGPYEIAGVVGRGGMGVVLKALDPALNRFVAIKVLAPQLATSGAARQRFAREARAAASVVHENVVAIHAVADGGALPYFVMPYLRGASLQKRIDAHGPLGPAEILRVSIQIAAGLSAAHAQGLVHRDIKPANILLEDGVERLKITDFGLARAADDASLTRTGVIAGTPQFMSPEQARGELVDSRSDLFSLASVMYAMCTARTPFRSETSYGTLQRICDAQPRPIREINPDIPLWLAAFVGRLHEKHPDQRFQTAQETAQLLEQCLAHLRQPDAVPLPPSIVRLAEVESIATTERRAEWHSDRSPSQRRAALFFQLRSLRTWMLGLAGCFMVGLLGLELGSRWWPQAAVAPAGNPAAMPSGQQVSTVHGQPLGAETPPLNSPGGAGHSVVTPQAVSPATVSSWDDEVGSQIQDLKNDIGRMESRISSLKQPPHNSPSQPETKP